MREPVGVSSTAIIRLATVDDAGAVVAIYGPIVRDTMISFEESAPTEAEIASRIEDTLSFAPWLVCEIDGAIVGYCYARKFKERAAYRWAVEISTYLTEGYRGKHIGRALVTSMLAALKVQQFTQVFGAIALPNPPSVRMFESFGAQHIGTQKNVGYKAGRWVDVGYWQLELTLPPERPDSPMPMSEAVRNLDCVAAIRSGSELLQR